MRRRHLIIIISILLSVPNALLAQINEIDPDGNITTRNAERGMGNEEGGRRREGNPDANKEIPKGLRVWTVDQRFGDVHHAEPDTMSAMFMNTIFTTGLRGEYNTTGNLGAPRINRIFINRPFASQFIFTQPYDFFIHQPQDFHFTNTLSPFTNLTYNTCGDRMNGEDHFTAKFAVNVNKQLGFGFNFDYLYGRGYYDAQSSSHFNYTMYGSYLGERYQAHLLLSTNHQKVAENGGITDDEYITHPEKFRDSYSTSEIPTVLNQNWNRNDNQHIFLTHRYNLGFSRKVPMTQEEIEAKKFAIASQKEQQEREEREAKSEEGGTRNENPTSEVTFRGRPANARIAGAEPISDSQESTTDDRISVGDKAMADSLLALDKKATADTTWMKSEYVPVTSFIHTMQVDNYRRIYQAYDTPENYFARTYAGIGKFSGDSIYDQTRHYEIRNTLAISMLEGFNKWAKAGIKLFATSYLRHFTLTDKLATDTIFNEHSLSIGGQICKAEGKAFHYNAIGETWIAGEDAGQLKLDATADLRFRFLGDTVTLSATGFFHRLNPTFYYRHYSSRHFLWNNNDMDKILHTRIEGLFNYGKTHTTLRVAVDEIQNHTYFGHSYQITSDGGRINNFINVRQCGEAITLMTASLEQNFHLGPLRWENVVTWQKSSMQDVLPMPDLNIYTNLFLRFRIAKVLLCDLGADARFFTSYYAPDYSPALGQFTVQETTTDEDGAVLDYRTKIGNCPIVNVYANFHLKHTRFFIMMSHVNAEMGKQNYFFTPHYPLNQRLIRFGISWNFFN